MQKGMGKRSCQSSDKLDYRGTPVSCCWYDLEYFSSTLWVYSKRCNTHLEYLSSTLGCIVSDKVCQGGNAKHNASVESMTYG